MVMGFRGGDMKKYDFSLDGILVSVITELDPLTEPWVTEDTTYAEDYRVFLYPVENADFGVRCVNKNNCEIREPHIPLAALSCFFKEVRHFPDVTLEILLWDKAYELRLGDDAVDFTVNVGKCKLLCTKTAKFADGIEVEANIILNEDTYAVVVCEDCESFNSDKLRRISEMIGMKRNTPIIACSFDSSVRLVTVGAIPFYNAIACVIPLLPKCHEVTDYGGLLVSVNGRSHNVFLDGANLRFSPSIKYLY